MKDCHKLIAFLVVGAAILYCLYNENKGKSMRDAAAAWKASQKGSGHGEKHSEDHHGAGRPSAAPVSDTMPSAAHDGSGYGHVHSEHKVQTLPSSSATLSVARSASSNFAEASRRLASTPMSCLCRSLNALVPGVCALTFARSSSASK